MLVRWLGPGLVGSLCWARRSVWPGSRGCWWLIRTGCWGSWRLVRPWCRSCRWLISWPWGWGLRWSVWPWGGCCRWLVGPWCWCCWRVIRPYSWRRLPPVALRSWLLILRSSGGVWADLGLTQRVVLVVVSWVPNSGRH